MKWPFKNNSRQDSAETAPWRSTLTVMFIAQLLSIVGFAFVLPFIPFYIREMGVTDEKLVPVWTGILGRQRESHHDDFLPHLGLAVGPLRPESSWWNGPCLPAPSLPSPWGWSAMFTSSSSAA